MFNMKHSPHSNRVRLPGSTQNMTLCFEFVNKEGDLMHNEIISRGSTKPVHWANPQLSSTSLLLNLVMFNDIAIHWWRPKTLL